MTTMAGHFTSVTQLRISIDWPTVIISHPHANLGMRNIVQFFSYIRLSKAYWGIVSKRLNNYPRGPRDAMLVIVIATCPSVCPSVTRRYCVQTKKVSGMISSPSGSPKSLVFWRQISSPNSKGFPPNGGLKQGSVGKIRRFSSFKRQYLENGSRYGQSYY